MSSPYQILENRPIDQWKVTELKEELKRRKLPVRGLKEDLVKRLDEAVRIERESAQNEDENGLESSPPPVVEENIETQETVVSEDFRGIADNDGKKLEKEDNLPVPVDTNSGVALSDQENIQDGYVFVGKKEDTLAEEETLVHETVVHASAKVTESVVPEVPIREQDLPKTEVQEESGNSERSPKTQLEIDNTKPQLENEYAKPTSEEVALDASAPENQVSEVSHNLGSPVKYDSISTDSVSINEKIEIKDNIIADNVKLELDNIKPEMVAPSSSPIVPVGGDSHPHAMDVEEPHENNTSVEEKDDINDNNNADMSKKFDSVDVGYSEKLNLDRSSGDDSMEEDVLESRQVESKYRSDVLGDGGEKIEISDVNEGGHVDIGGDDICADKEDGNDKDRPFTAAEKRKLDDESLVGNNEPVKRQRRWNTESVKVPEPQSSNLTPTPKDTLQSPATKRFSRADSITDEDALKERVVPPSPKPPTNSLRVDRFLRPFTLKAVQELLGKTGKVTSFWMDHIKTHCYVTYSSVEEAVETRNAVYNLQWPPNGGRQLLAEFVDPQEVKTRLETPQTPAVSASAVPAVALTPPGLRAQESPRQPRQQQQKVPEAPASLPPPPPLSSPLQARERLTLPPPPPLPEKLEPPIMTLDDLFRKTKVTPRVYYLPLSEEQVAMKHAAQGRSAK